MTYHHDVANNDYNSGLKYSEKSTQYRTNSNKRQSEEDDENVSPAATVPFKVPRINTLGTHCYDVPSSKRSAENDFDIRNNAYNKIQGRFKKRNSPYGIVYNQGKPIGILEPISQVYEYSNFKESEQAPEEIIKESMKKRETDAVESEHDLKSHSSSVSGGKYASILASFKIGNRMKMRPLTEEVALQNNLEKKRERAYYKRSLSDDKKIPMFPVENKKVITTKEKRELSDKNLIEIEDNLKSIMNDLGLSNENNINKREITTSTKRETFSEDEDLEKGLNKIGLTKESHIQRDKKENCPGKTADAGVTKRSISKNYRKGNEIPSSDDTNIEGDIITKKSKKVNPNKIVDFRSEGEAYIRQKRQQSKQSADSTDIVKGLETSGDLTVSGNKSPLASSSNNAAITEPNETQQATQQHKTQHINDRDERKEDSEYEKRLQRNIQSKISEIKEQVKREINALKQSKESKNSAAKETKKEIKKEAKSTEKSVEKKKRDNDNDQSVDEKKNAVTEKKIVKTNEVEKKKRADDIEKKLDADKTSNKEKKDVRSKRNLMDADTSNIDPGVNLEDKLDPHERRRRDTSSDNWDGDNGAEEDKESRVTWRELNEDDTQSDINKREGTADALNPIRKATHPVAHDPKLFQFEPRAKRAIDIDSVKVDVEKENLISDNKAKKEVKREIVNTENIVKTANDETSSQITKSNIVKRNLNQNKLIVKANGDDTNSNFWDAQNQNVAKTGLIQTPHAIVSRSLDLKSVPVANNKQPLLKQVTENAKGEVKRSSGNNSQTHKQDLIKLITESDVLTRTVSKKQRDARSGEQANIEVELHSGAPAASEKEGAAKLHDAKKSTDTSSLQKEDADTKLTPDFKSLEHSAKPTMLDNQVKITEDKSEPSANEKRSVKQRKVAHEKTRTEGGSDGKFYTKVGDLKLVQAKLNEDKAIMIENAAMVNAENKITEEKMKGEESTPVATKIDAKLTEDKPVEILAPNGETKLTEDKVDANLIPNENSNVFDDDTNLENAMEVEFAENKGNPAEDKQPDDKSDDKVKVADEHNENSELENSGEVDKNSVKRKRSADQNIAAKRIVDEKLSNEGDNERVNRKERTLEPSVSLDDMQRLDSANNMRRRRRRQAGYYNRKKRDDLEDTSNMQFRSYRGDEDEADDESDEFDDDNFDDRTSNFIRKRAIAYGNQANDYDEFDEDYEPVASNAEYRNNAQRLNKRNLVARNYVNDLNSDVYENSNNYLYGRAAGDRKKRQTFEDIASLHGGGPMVRHLAAIRERNQQPLDNNYRMKRLEKLNQKQSKDQNIAGLSESDIFGGFPQSYEGELNRFKRVKRDKFT